MLVFWLTSTQAIQENRYFTLLPYKLTSQKLPELYNIGSKDFKKKNTKNSENSDSRQTFDSNINRRYSLLLEVWHKIELQK